MIKSSADKATSLETEAGEAASLADLELGSRSDRIVLALEDFVANGSGEVVVFNDSAVATMALATSAEIVGQGTTDRTTTTDGQPIVDFRYYAFDNGITVYYPEGLEILIEKPSA